MTSEIPSRLTPWFVVFKRPAYEEEQYYTTELTNAAVPRLFSLLKAHAQLFYRLEDADRIASALKAEGAMIRVLTRKDEAKEFGHGPVDSEDWRR